ncbi:MAG: GPI anchored serine-threonine rich family protein [Patescibacteria group bacterium]|nr:GPI anchored serine-threonine rich family protein [Patescibacteria group bacterium]
MAYPEISQENIFELPVRTLNAKVMGLSNSIPVGYVDQITSDGQIRGWAYDPDRPDESVEVHFYLDKPAGEGRLIGFTHTEKERSDVNEEKKITGLHGFKWQIPTEVKDGQKHVIYAYAIDTANPSLNAKLTDSAGSVILVAHSIGEDVDLLGTAQAAINSTEEQAAYPTTDYSPLWSPTVLKTYTSAILLVVRDPAEATAERLQILNQVRSFLPAASKAATYGRIIVEAPDEISVIVATPDMYEISSDGYILKHELITNAFYQNHSDVYDFLYIYPSFPTDGYYHTLVSNNVEGIGLGIFNDFGKYGSSGRLKGINNMYWVDNIFNQGLRGHMWYVVHEGLGHQFCCYFGEVFDPRLVSDPTAILNTDTGHFFPGLSFFDERQNKEILYANKWELSDSGSAVLAPQVGDVIPVFHPFALYTMGVLPEAEFSRQYPVYSDPNPPTAPNEPSHPAVYNKSVSVNDIISRNGPRLERPLQTLRLLSPQGGEKWEAGKTYVIRWEGQNLPSVYIRLVNDLNPTEITIADNIANSGSFEWTIPTTLPPADSYRMIICDTRDGNAGVHVQSNGTFSIESAPAAGSATFVASDTKTQGNWKNAYGNEGYNIIGGSVNYPSYVQVLGINNIPFIWADPSSDVRALQKADSDVRVAASWYNYSQFSVDMNFTDNNEHQVALYFLDYDSYNRGQTVDVLDAVSGQVLNSQNIFSFHDGKYLSWQVKGHVKFRITSATGSNVVLSGMFFGTGMSAVFVNTDNNTQGNWKSAYGGEGYLVVNDSSFFPIDAHVLQQGGQLYTWADNVSDIRALQKGSRAEASDFSSRIASSWFAPNNFTVEVSFADNMFHQVALYFLDYDSFVRSELVEVRDVSSGKLLDSRQVSSFHGGRYLVWNVKGRVTFRITLTGGGNAVLSGVFVGGPSSNLAAGSATFVASDTKTQGNWKNAYGNEGYNIIGGSVNYPSYVQVLGINNIPFIWADPSSDVRALQKADSDVRVAASWYNYSQFSVDMNFTDNNEHQVALYFLDYDSYNRGQTVDVLDAVSGQVLNSQNIFSFHDGKYLSWQVKGHVKFRITSATGSNVVLSGMFFDSAAAAR